MSQKLYEVGNSKHRGLHSSVPTVSLFHQTSIPALKCEVRKLWYISSFWHLANFMQSLYHRSGIFSSAERSTYSTQISPYSEPD